MKLDINGAVRDVDASDDLDGDQGAGRLRRTEDVVAVDWAGAAIDIDTEEDVVGLAAREHSARSSRRH